VNYGEGFHSHLLRTLPNLSIKSKMIGLNLLAKALIVFGLILIILGTLLTLGGKISWLGRLPGDICIHRKGFSFYFPITTCILISIVLTIILWLVWRR